MSFDNVDLDGLVFLVYSIPFGSYTPSASFLMCSLSPEGKDVMETSHLMLSIPMSLTSCIMSVCGSLPTTVCC